MIELEEDSPGPQSVGELVGRFLAEDGVIGGFIKVKKEEIGFYACSGGKVVGPMDSIEDDPIGDLEEIEKLLGRFSKDSRSNSIFCWGLNSG